MENKQRGLTHKMNINDSNLEIYTYYDKIKHLNALERQIGLQRLGRVLRYSRNIQALTGRDIFALSQIFYSVGVSATHVGDLERGVRLMREDTLQRLVPFLFEVEYFDFVGNDQIGFPHFKYKGANYKNTEKQRRLKVLGKFVPTGTNEDNRPKISDLPDLDYRYQSCRQLVDIILGGEHITSKHSLQPQDNQQTYQYQSNCIQSNTPILSFG